MGEWALALLRCPCCLSQLTVVSAPLWPTLRCAQCQRVHAPAAEGTPRLRRDDPLATLAQDIVVYQYDPDSTPREPRATVRRLERRERFLHAVGQTVDPATPAAPTLGYSDAKSAMLGQFLQETPTDGTVLDLAYAEGGSLPSLSSSGRRVLVAAGDGARLASARTCLAEHARGALAFVEADMLEMPLASASLDGVWCDTAYATVRPDRRTVFFRQVHRVLRRGGVVCLDAATRPFGEMARHFLQWRIMRRRPLIFGEQIVGPPLATSQHWRYQAVTSEAALRALCHEHGFVVLSLQPDGYRLLLLARKVR